MKLIVILLHFYWTIGYNTVPELEQVRSNYAKAAQDKQVCKAMIVALTNAQNSPLYQAYLGGYRAMWAKHILNPISKLNTFNKGKKDIEAAILADPSNIELRFVRLSVQKNCPSFLGYNSHIQIDTKLLTTHKHTIKSPMLSNMIDNILKAR